MDHFPLTLLLYGLILQFPNYTLEFSAIIQTPASELNNRAREMVHTCPPATTIVPHYLHFSGPEPATREWKAAVCIVLKPPLFMIDFMVLIFFWTHLGVNNIISPASSSLGCSLSFRELPSVGQGVRKDQLEVHSRTCTARSSPCRPSL